MYVAPWVRCPLCGHSIQIEKKQVIDYFSLMSTKRLAIQSIHVARMLPQHQPKPSGEQ